MGVFVALTVIALFSLFGSHPLFLSFYFPFFSMQGSIEYKLGTPIAPTQHQGFIAENALLMHMERSSQ